MSNRIVWPYTFTLKVSQQVTPQRRPIVAEEDVSADPYGELGIPVDLRWATVPELGFPRQPFRVWRRARINIPAGDIQTLLATPTQVNGSSDLPFPTYNAGLIYMVGFAATPATGGVLVIAPYDLRGMTIPGVLFETTYAQSSFFICPGMAGLRVAGEGTVSIVVGVDQETYANLPDWELIQTVGLPTQPSDLMGAAYASGEAQGFDIAGTTGVRAAEERMLLSHFFQKQPPPSGDATVPVPVWPKSNPTQYIKNLRSGTNLIPMIAKCLQNSNDANPAQMQSIYLETVNNLGDIFQANIPGQTAQTQTTTVDIPVVGLSMMSVSTDSDAALALGYGTVDIPLLDAIAEVLAYYAEVGSDARQTNPLETILAVTEAESLIPYDYMVTAKYVLPFGLTLQLAALSQSSLPVQAVTGFNASLLNTHAVLTRDTGAEVAVELTWNPGIDPQAAGILVSRSANQSAYLNTARPAGVGGYDPYLGLPPVTPAANADPLDLLPNLKDSAGTAPVDGSQTTKYLAAGIDVFGRWSPWTETEITLNSSSVTVPGLNKVSWIVGTLPNSGTKVPYSLQMEVLWNWADRSPGEIAISGNFVPLKTGLGPTAYLNALAMNNDAAAGPPVVLSWDYTGFDPTTVAPGTILPTVDASHPGSTVVLLNDVSGIPNNEVMHYLVTVPGFVLDYASNDQVALALYVTATERVRPGEWSSPIDPNAPPSPPAPSPTWIGRVAVAINPLPPVVSFNPPEISWTALPDAYSLAHGILSWSGGGPVAGYMVWEATESGLLQLLSAPDPAPTATLVERGTALKALVTNNFNASLQGFTRLNTDPIQATSYEVEVPGNASVLYCYMISAVSTQGVESQRTAANSAIAVFGVPQRVVPRQPRMRLRPNAAGIQVVALAVEGDVLAGREIVAGYRVFRCRSAALSADAGLMGPAVYLERDPNWTPYSETPLRGGTTATGLAIVDTDATPSWYPWYYRVQAIGVQDLTNGMYSGKSLPSQVQSAYNEPPNPPLIASAVLTVGSGAALVTFTADLPIPASPLGPALVELLQASADPNHAGRFMYQSIEAEAPDAVKVGTLALPIPWWTPPGPGHPGHPPIPPPYHPPDLGPALARSAPSAQGTFTLYVLVPYAAADENTYTVRLTDPLGRQSSYSF